MRLGVLFEEEIVFGEVVDEGVVFVADGNEEVDGVDLNGDGHRLLGGSREVLEGKQAKAKAKELFHGASKRRCEEREICCHGQRGGPAKVRPRTALVSP